MKTLRLLRNIAALFILVAALLVYWPGVGSLQASNGKSCLGTKVGFNCGYDSNGNCSETKCVPGQACANAGCVDFNCGRGCGLPLHFVQGKL